MHMKKDKNDQGLVKKIMLARRKQNIFKVPSKQTNKKLLLQNLKMSKMNIKKKVIFRQIKAEICVTRKYALQGMQKSYLERKNNDFKLKL